MMNPDIRDQAYRFFIEEAAELLQVIEVGLLTLREERSKAKVHEIMRAAHSIKGGAASVDLDAIRILAHRLEDYFKVLYREDVILDAELETLLLQGFDCLKTPLVQQIETGQLDAESVIAAAQPIFTQIEARLGDALHQSEDYLPSSADLGIDIVASIFDIDVEQGIETLSNALINESCQQLTQILASTLEVFDGFAQMLNLSGFAIICQTIRTAISQKPQKVKEITELAIDNFQQAREQVLKGDRTTGGTPSEELLTFLSFDGNESAIPCPPLDEIFSFENAEMGESLVLEEIFASELNEIFITPDDHSEVLASAIPLLEDVFSSPEMLASELPSLDEIFGSIETTDKIDNLDETIEFIEKTFEELPPAQPFESLPIKATPDRQLSNDKMPAPKSEATPSLSVRVDFNRLERMSNLVGELAINRNSLSLQNEHLQTTVRELLNRFRHFEIMTQKLRELSDRMLIAPMRRENNEQAVNNANIRLQNSEFNFDALEMDRYGRLYSLLQGLLEDMMQLEESVDDIVLFARGSNQTLETQRQMLTSLRDELMWARMLPLGEVLNRFPRVLRDLSNTHHKLVHLKLIGTGVLVDKAALEKLYDPLLHLLRNAFDHGIESPEARREQGKAEEGQIEIRAYHQGNQTIIEIKDDGQGLNFEKIGQQALKMRLVTPEQLSVMNRERLAQLIFEPQFSTAEKVSELSGRGVGLDVVREQLRSLKGTVTVASILEKGTTFTLRLPLTLTIAKLLVCLIHPTSTGSQATALAIPSDSIEEIIVPQEEQIKKLGHQRFLHFAEQIIPIYPLSDLLSYHCPLSETFSSKALATAVPLPNEWGLPLLLLRQEEQLYALEVHRLVTEQELVIKSFGSAIAAPAYTYGCTILGDGSLIPVVNGLTLLEQSLKMGDPTLENFEPQIAEAIPVTTSIMAQMPTILIVDDSAALRKTLALTLQKSGYRILQARDGREALEQLHQSSGIQLVICDVEMPNMNGFEFLGQRRRDSQLMDIPVAMLTSRSSDKHRHLAMHLGANAYFTKPYIEQQFLTAIQNLIPVPK